jgi:peptidyl-tRNA hydrolase
MANLRQTILIRTDLKFPIGLLAAQVAHLHMETLRQEIRASGVKNDKDPTSVRFDSGVNTLEWLDDPYVFVHGVPNLEVLNHFAEKADHADIVVSSWRDTVYIDISSTQREAFPDVLIGIVLGPADSDAIKVIIGDLPLL